MGRVGGRGIEQKKKKDLWTWTTEWWLQGGYRGLNGIGKHTIKIDVENKERGREEGRKGGRKERKVDSGNLSSGLFPCIAVSTMSPWGVGAWKTDASVMMTMMLISVQESHVFC